MTYRHAMAVAIALISVSIFPFGSTAVAQTASLSSATAAFGSTVVGLTSTRVLTVSNTGTSNLVISNVSATGSFHATNCTNPTIVPQGSCTLSITFSPTAAGSATGTLTITDNATNNPQTVSLSGTGLLGVSLTATTLQYSSEGSEAPVQPRPPPCSIMRLRH